LKQSKELKMTDNGLAAILGAEKILDAGEVLEAYAEDLSFAPRMVPRCVVRPDSVREVQALVRWANETSTTLVPVSSGPPHFHGDTVPGRDGAVVVDLSGMDRILRVDAKNRVAMVEAGVTFHALVPVLAQEGLRLNLPLLPRREKSVVGSMLEREPVVMPLYQWDAIDPLACIEVIFGTGETFRTGSAAGPGTLKDQWETKQAQINPMGPGQTDFARVVQGAQGTMGIVTWATVRCEKIPTMEKPFLVGADRLDEITDFVYRSLWLKAADMSLVVGGATLAAMMSKDADEFSDMQKALPNWLYFFSLAGFEYFPGERVTFQEKDILDAAGQFNVRPRDAVSGISARELLGALSKPSPEPYWKLRPKGACQDVFFLTTLDRAPKFMETLYGMAAAYGFSAADIGAYIQPMVQGTSCHCEFNLFYDPGDASEAEKVREITMKACDAVLNLGGYFSRPPGDTSDRVYQKDPDSAAVLKKVKGIFDPNNIMNTGKLCFR
jgi:FAD/FMN-containing dehydrogenase